ncbi:MAG: universal stress protein [Alphaproteobacteria bacterium]|nr:universal stress protein [Alphaproteobacteria bacterium]
MLSKDILCFFESREGELTPAVKQALALAIAHKAHLTIVPVARLLTVPGIVFGGSVAANALAGANNKTRETAAAAVQLAHEAAKLAGLNHASDVLQATLADASAWLSRRARTADLTVVDRPGDVIDAKQAYFEDALFSSGRPVLIASPEHVSEHIRKIAVAWDGSRVAARVLGDAMSVFPEVSEADVIVVTGEKALSNAVPGVEAARYLARCEIKAEVVDVKLAGRTVAEALNETVRQRKADVIVMGGFGHSRLREFILGGVTRELSATAARPLMLSH